MQVRHIKVTDDISFFLKIVVLGGRPKQQGILVHSTDNVTLMGLVLVYEYQILNIAG